MVSLVLTVTPEYNTRIYVFFKCFFVYLEGKLLLPLITDGYKCVGHDQTSSLYTYLVRHVKGTSNFSPFVIFFYC